MFKAFTVTLIILGTCLVLYFSWESNPNIGLNPYFPRWLGVWTNKNGNLRTAVPFVFLGLIADIGLVHANKIWKKRLEVLTITTAIIVIAELGQLLLPKRHFDLQDIMWGIIGSSIGIGIADILKRVFTKYQSK